MVHRKAAVAVAAMTANGEIVLIREERIPVRAALWEVPAGQIDQSGDPSPAKIEEVALRELREETGYRLATGGQLLPLGLVFSSPGMTDERVHLFLARHVEMSEDGHAHDESESILDIRTFAPREIARMITNGEIRDTNTLGVCARLIASGLLSFTDNLQWHCAIFQVPRNPRIGIGQAVSRTSRGPALDDRENGHRAFSRHDVVARFSASAHALMQRPLQRMDPEIRALQSLGITDSFTISFRLAFYAGIVLSFPILLYFLAEFVLPALTAGEKRLMLPAIGASFLLFLVGVLACYYWLLPTTVRFFFIDAQSLGWTPVDGAGILFLRDALHDRLRSRLRVAGGGARARQAGIGYLRIHGPHPALRGRADFRPRGCDYAHPGCPHDDGDGLAHVCALQSCIWIAWFMQRRRKRLA